MVENKLIDIGRGVVILNGSRTWVMSTYSNLCCRHGTYRHAAPMMKSGQNMYRLKLHAMPGV